MGTRSQTIFIETWKDEKTSKKVAKKIATMYCQFDGYPSGHGAELADFLKDGKLVNGLSGGSEKVFNGVGCLAAQVVAHFKDGPGGIYLRNPNSGIGWEDYVYEVEGDFNTNQLTLRCFETKYNAKTEKTSKGKKLFEGHPKDFEKFLEKEAAETE